MMFKECLENQIVYQEVYYRCCLCSCKLKKDFEFVIEHVASYEHKKRLEKIDKEQREKQLDKLVGMSELQLKQIVENSITFYGCSDSFYCHLCECSIGELCDTFEHTKDVLHQIASKRYLAKYQVPIMNRRKFKITDLQSQIESNCITFDEKNCLDISTNTSTHSISDFISHDEECNLYFCTICKCKFVSTTDNSENIQESLSRAMLEISNTLENIDIENTNKETVLQENVLRSCINEIYCCVTCQAFLKDSADIQCHVMIHLFKEFQLLNNFDILEFNHGTDGKFDLKCLLCNYDCCLKMSDAHEFLKAHFKTRKHLERLTFFQFTKNDLGLENMDEQINSLDLNKFTYNTAHDIHLLKHPSSHDALRKCCEKQLNEVKSDEIIERKTEFDLNNLHYYKCFMCNTSFDNVSKLFEHFKTPAHKWKIEALRIVNEKCLHINFIRLNEIEIIVDSACNKYFIEFFTLLDHIRGKPHNNKLKFISNNQRKLAKSKISKNSMPLDQVLNVLEDMRTKSLQRSTKKHEKNTTADSTQNPTVIITTNLKDIEKEMKFEAMSDDELNQLGLNKENGQPVSLLQSDWIDNLLHNLISLDFTKYQINRLPMNARPKLPKVKDKKNSFATNVLQNGKTFLKFCINSGPDNIYNFANETAILMELGVALTFPECFDRICIPCGQKFSTDEQTLFEHLQNQEHLKNICKMIIDDKEVENLPEKFSQLRLAKLYMHTSDKSIKCRACNIKIKNDNDIIREHVQKSSHDKKSKLWKKKSEQLFTKYSAIYKDIWYYAEVFFCGICKTRFKFEIDFAMHLTHPKHMKKVNKLENKGTALKFDFCHSCITYWFGEADSYGVHCESDDHKLIIENNEFMIPDLTMIASEYLDNIDKKVDFLVRESDKVDSGEDKVNALLDAILEAVKPKYPNAKAYVFGSRLSQLGFPDSDVDVFLDCENVYYKSSTTEQSQKRIKSVEDYFENAPNTWIIDEVLLDTRVPIMKLRHMPTKLKCDISFANGLTVEKSRLLGIYNRAFPICRKLILFMKKWLSLCRIFGSEYITTFAISWCVIFYLQLQGILPNVHELINRKMESKIVDGWECGFEETITAESSNLSFKEHLKGFFTYFANFDYQRGVINPFLGKVIDKRTFAYADELPPEMYIYEKRLQNNEVEIFRFDSPMCIQDPVDLSQNLTKAVKKLHLRYFRQYCAWSAEKC